MRSFIVKSLIIENNVLIKKISIQTVIKKGIPLIKILGIPQQKSNELSIKLQTIFLSNNITLPYENIQINISPSGLKNYPNYLDMSIFASIFFAIYEDKITNFHYREEQLYLGELNILGELEYLEDIISIIIHGKRLGFNTFIIPDKNFNDTIQFNGISYIPLKNISDFYKNNFSFQSGKINIPEIYTLPDEIKILKSIFRLVPLLSGKHSFYLIEKQIQNKKEILDSLIQFLPEMKVQELENLLMLNNKDFRRPTQLIQNNIQKKDLIGDQKNFTNSIIFKNQYGILLFENINLFNKNILITIKEILEQNNLQFINYTIPDTFWIILTTLPCPCGNFFNNNTECICNAKQIKNFYNLFSLYLKDKIDIFYFIENEYITIKKSIIKKIKDNIKKSLEIQEERYKEEIFKYNSQIPGEKIDKYCAFVDIQTEEFWNEYTQNLLLTEKRKIRKIARTIADYNSNLRITKNDILFSLKVRNSISLIEEPKIQSYFNHPLK